MKEPPERPWLRFPELFDAEQQPKEGIALVVSWMNFLYGLTPDELLECERDYPAPPVWDQLYKAARQTQRIHASLGAKTPAEALIEKLWQGTTLK